jgi:hypothetical protein
LVSIGPLIILLNGGYSILGMAWLSDKVGPYGRMFWNVATIWTVAVPIAQKAGLPLDQPVLPCLMVCGISALEIALILYRLRHADAGLWVTAAGYAVAVFDYISTAIGLVFAPFAAGLGQYGHFGRSSRLRWPCRSLSRSKDSWRVCSRGNSHA